MEEQEFDLNFDNIQLALDDYAKQFVAYLKTLMQQKNSKGYNRVASGQLLASLKTRMENDSNFSRYIVYLIHRDYLKYLEDGTRPHWPPKDAILQWVRDKGLETKEKSGKKGLPTEKQLAFLVQRKIANEGTKGIPMVKQTQDTLNPVFERKLEQAFEQDIEHYLLQPKFVISLRFDSH